MPDVIRAGGASVASLGREYPQLPVEAAAPVSVDPDSRDDSAASVSADRIRFLDGWRGMAILFVLLGHFLAFAPAKLADAGVECFFVLSGRLMAEILILRRHPLPSFLARRASRIVPALIFYVAAMILFAPVASAFGSRADAAFGGAAVLGFFHNYLPAAGVVPIFEHTWSLAVEEHSYLLLAAITLLTMRDARAAMVAAFLIAAIAFLNGIRLTAIADPAQQWVYWRTDVRCASISLAFGIYIWARHYCRAEWSARLAFLSPLSLIAGLAIVLQATPPDYLRFGMGTMLLAISVGTIDFAHPLFRRLFELPALAWFGMLSYSLYLWQQPFYVLSHVGAPVTSCALAAIILALLSFHRVERPARTYLNELWTSRIGSRAKPVEAPSAA